MRIVTTPLFYVNAKPHIGHLYSMIIADIFKKSFDITYRIGNDNSQFNKKAINSDINSDINSEIYHNILVTGTDDHGKKVALSAYANNAKPSDFANSNSETFYHLSRKIFGNDFIFQRTLSSEHHKNVVSIWHKLKIKGYIYKGEYSGWYAISDEAYYKESDTYVLNGTRFAKVSNSEVQYHNQDAYFFKLSNFKDQIMQSIQNGIIHAQSAKNEMLNIVQSDISDLCITRSDTDYGISVPDDQEHTMYVWFDALLGYMSAVNNANIPIEYLNNIYHVVGKDILKFHAIYYIGILIALDIPLPKKIISHGWLIDDNNTKISKSKGNAVDCDDLLYHYGEEGIRYIMADMYVGCDDIAYSMTRMTEIYNSILVNEISNLFYRMNVLLHKKSNGILYKSDESDLNIRQLKKAYEILDMYQNCDISGAVHNIKNMVKALNAYISNHEIWNLSDDAIKPFMYNIFTSLKDISFCLYPILPSFSCRMLHAMSITNINRSILEYKIPDMQYIYTISPAYQRIK